MFPPVRSTCDLSIRRIFPSERRGCRIVVTGAASCLLAVLVLTTALFHVRGRFLGVDGLWLVGLLGLADDGGIDRLIEKVKRVTAGETDVDFATDRDDDLGRLSAAVGDLAETAQARERRLATAERRREELFQITSATDRTPDETIHRLLELGCDRLGVENGHVVDIDCEDGRHEVVAAAGSDLVAAGTVSSIEDTFCRETVESDAVLAIADTDESAWAGEAPAETWDIDCYIGAPVSVDGERYGTVCFVDREPRDEPFDRLDRIFVDLLAHSVSQLIERREHAAAVRLKDRAMDAAPVGVTIADAGQADNPLVYVNEAFEDVTGYAAEDALGRNCRFLQGPDTDPDRVAELRAAIDAARPVTVELRNYRPDGTMFWNRVSISPVTDEDGDVTHFVGFQQDVTDERERRRRFRETSERLAATIEASPAAIITIDLDGTVEGWNRAAEEIFGWEAAEVEGEPLPFVSEGDAAEFARLHDQLAAGKTLERIETRRPTKDGDLVDVSLSAAPIYMDGEVAGIVGVLEDITDRKAAERRLRETKDRLSSVVDASPVAIVALDTDDRVTIWNPAAERIFGWSAAEVLGEPLPTVPEGMADDHREIFEDLLGGEHLAGVETRRRTKDGDLIDVSLSGAPLRDADGNVVGTLGLLEDISERKATERELRETKRTLEIALEQTKTGVWQRDLGSDEVVWDETLEAIVGLEPGGFEGTTDAFRDRVHPEDLPDVDAAIEHAEAHEELLESEFRLRHEDGGWIWVAASGRFLVDDDGTARMLGTLHDVTRRKERELELERYREFTGDLLDAIDDVFYVFDETGSLQRWNDSLAAVTGYSPADLDGIDVLEFFEGDDRERVEAAIEEVHETGETRVEADYVTVDGDHVPFEFVASSLTDLDGNPVVVGIGRDITERRVAERQLSRLMSNVPGIVYRMANEPQWPAEFVSEGIATLTGYDPTDLESGDVTWGEDVMVERDGTVWDAVQDALDRNEPFTLTYPIETADGERRWVKENGRGVYADDGSVEALEGVIIDVTERVEYEQELERTRDLMEQSQRLAQVGAWEVFVEDGEPIDLVATDEVFRIHDLSLDADLDLDEALEYYHPEYRQQVSDAVVAAIRDIEGYDLEARFETAAGDQRWVRSIGDPVTEDGEVVAVRGSIQDITERRERERVLERTTDLLGRAEEMADVGGWSMDLSDGSRGPVQWTDKLYDIFELPPDEDPPTADLFEFYHPEDRERHRAAVDHAVETGEGWDQELRLVTAEGTERWVRNIGETVVEDGEVVEIRGSIQDVTARREREAKLRERERDLRAHTEYTADILNAIEDVFYVVDADGTFLRWNESLRTVTGYDDAAIAEANALEFFREEDHEQILEAIDDVLAASGSRRIEAPLVTSDGNVIPHEFVASAVENPEGEAVIVGIGRDITERKRREAQLERTTELLEQAQRLAAIGGWELDLESDELTVTDEFRRLHGFDPDEPVTLDAVLSYYHPEDVDEVRQTFEETIETGEGYDMEVRLQTAEGTTRWVRALGEPIVTDGEVTRIRGSVQDITEPKEREEALRALHETAEALLQIETPAAVAELVVETAEDVLDVDGVCLFHLDEATSRLVPAACTRGFAGTPGDVPPVPVGDEGNPIWNCFATGTRQVLDKGDEAAGLFADRVGGALVVPIGDHGVLGVTTSQPGIAARTRRLVETLVATTEAALDRLESEAAVRERDEALAEQNRRLRRQIQLTDVLRRVDQSLIGADSREAVETAVTEELASADDIAFAWIGRPDASGDRLVPEAWAGSGESYLDSGSLELADANAEPAVEAARTGEPSVVENVVADLRGAGWRKPAVDSGFTSALAVPIALEEFSYGVLAVYAGEPGVFGDLEREVFAELGRTIASAINDVQTREALHADRLVELRLNFGDSESFLTQVASAAGCPVEYVGTAARSEDLTRLFFAAECDASDALADLVTVSEYRLLSETDGRWVYEAGVSGEVLPAKLLRHGANPESIRATPTDLSVVVHVPTGTDVREFVEMFSESYSSVELEGRRSVERPTRTRQQVVGDLLTDLTERQREVLRTAYYAGFFDWPRDTTGEELAEMLGITQPTVSRHLRLGQHRLLAQLFDEEVVPAAA